MRYDELILASDRERGRRREESLHTWKAALVNQLKPDIFFEDMPEVVSLIEPGILVFMPCDEVIRSWISTQLGRHGA